MAAPMSIPISSSSEIGWDGGFFVGFLFGWVCVGMCLVGRGG